MAHISEGQVLQISRFYTGWFTYRNPLIVPIRTLGRRIIELYDALWDGLNMECSNRLTLARRPGFTPYSTVPLNGMPLYFYSFKPANFPNQIYTVADTTGEVDWVQPGAIAPITLLRKSTPAPVTFAQVAAFLYMASANFSSAGNQQSTAWKWDSPLGVQGLTKWGIDINDPNGAIGPHSFGQIENMALSQSAPAWGTAGPGSVTVPPPSTLGGTAASQWMMLTQFHFSMTTPPPPYVTGVALAITGLETQGTGISLNVQLTADGALIGIPHTVVLPPNSSNVGVGGPSDLWGTSIQPADVNKLTFGVAIQAVNQSTLPATYTVTGVTMSIYRVGGPQVTITGGTLNASVGYQYQYTYGNSYSGHISSPTPPSTVSGGPNDPLIVPQNQGVLITMTSSPDPQVTHIHVYRTTDGGGQPFYELPNSPVANGAPGTLVTLTDNAQDWQLQVGEICPAPHFNDPPPQGAVDPVWFGGRLWLHKKNLLFFASGPDITQGNGQEAWYPPYVFEIPHAEIIRKFATPNGLLVMTVDNIYIVRGVSTASFTVNDFMLDTGMRNWYAGDTDGTNIYLFTSDRQLLLINANGLSSISQNIADKVKVVDPALARTVIYRYTSEQNYLMLADGSTFYYPFNVELQAWGLPAAPVDGIGALATVETQPGVFQLWRARPTVGSLISYRDPQSWLDEGIAYRCFAVFGAIPTADFLTLSQIRDVVWATIPTSTQRLLSVLANEIEPVADKQFQLLEISSSEPPLLAPSLSYWANRYSWMTSPLPEFTNLLFLRFDFSAVNNPDELLCWTIAGTQTTGGSSLGQAGQLPQIQGR